MTTMIEESNILIEPEEEVRKLQELVKKLKRQNQILRSKQDQNKPDIESNVISVKSDSDEQLKKRWLTKTDTFSSNINDNSNDTSLDDVELLDLNTGRQQEKEEDCWLYMSPRQPSPAQRSVSPYKWVRQDFENPNSDVETCKRRLLFKLDDLARGVQGCFSKNHVLPTSLSSPSMVPGCDNTSTVNSTDGRVSHLHHSQSASDGLGTNVNDSADSSDSDAAPKNSSPELPSPAVSRINTSTFTRPKHGAGKRGAVLQYNSELQKRKTSLSPTPSPRDTPSPCDVDSSPEARQNGNGVGDDNGNENDGGAPMWHRLADVEDVQVMARMQEESLRQSLSSPAPRRSLPRGLAKSTASGLSSLHDNVDGSSSNHSSNRSSPGRFDLDQGYSTLQRSCNSLASGSSRSNSPPDSPYGSQILERRPQATDPSYRSMPNLAGRIQRASPPSHDSDSQLSNNSRQQQPRRSLGTCTALKAPSSGNRALSPRRVGQIVAPARTLSPMRGSKLAAPSQSMLPAPKARGIPRISSASRLPSPRRSMGSGLRKPSSTTRLGESWKDGCY